MELASATVTRLIQMALDARTRAYAPYSHFPVGAAVLADDGRVFIGCNVENSSFGLTICAERNAVAAAIAAGVRPIAAAVIANGSHVQPCGACRQVLAEFDPKMPIVLCSASGEDERTIGLDELLPFAFKYARPEGA